MSEELEKQFALSEKNRKNIEYILESAPKVNEVYEKLNKVSEMGIAPIQKALDEIDILKQNQTERHRLLLEMQQAIGQVQVRDTELNELEKKLLQVLLKKLGT